MMHPTRGCGMALLFLRFSNIAGDEFDFKYLDEFATSEDCQQQCGYVVAEAEAICKAVEGSACVAEGATNALIGIFTLGILGGSNGGGCDAAGGACSITEAAYFFEGRNCEEYCDFKFSSKFELTQENIDATREAIQNNLQKLSKSVANNNIKLTEELILAQETIIDSIKNSIKYSKMGVLKEIKKYSDKSLTLIKGIENDLKVLAEELHYVHHILLFGETFDILDTIEVRYANVRHDSNTGLIVRNYELDKYVEAVTNANFGMLIGIEDIRHMLITGNGKNWVKSKSIYEENSAEFCSAKWFSFFSLKLTRSLFHYRNGRRMQGNPLPASFSEKEYHEEHLLHYSEVCLCSQEDLPTIDGRSPIDNNSPKSTVGDVRHVECWGEIKDAVTCEERGQWSVNRTWIEKDLDGNWICKALPPVYFLAGGAGAYRDITLYVPSNKVSCPMLLPPLNNDWVVHTSFYHDNTMYLCGGWYTASTCISHNKDTEGWKTHTLTTPRMWGHSSVVFNNILYLIGGQDSSRNYVGAEYALLPLTKTPVLTPVNNLDYKGENPCTARIDEDTFVITGGRYGSYLTMVATYNVRTRKYTQLPSLKQPRYKHGCGVLERGDTKWIVVAGGYNYGAYGGILQTTKALQWGGGDWISLGNLNMPRTGHSIVITQRGLMVIGGWGAGNHLSSVELLDWDSAGKTWSVVQPSLNKLRDSFGGAVEIPASMFECTGWTIIQHRGQYGNAANYFYKDFIDYENGFGSVDGELWIGLKKLAALTKDGEWELQVDLTDWDDKKYRAKYTTFSVGPAPTYKLHVGGFDDGESTLGDSMTYSNGAAFSARDKDQDIYSRNCALQFKGAWWYQQCYRANLNALNFAQQKILNKGMTWMIQGKRPGHMYKTSKASVMKIRRVKV